jgi:hypothetical protein
MKMAPNSYGSVGFGVKINDYQLKPEIPLTTRVTYQT